MYKYPPATLLACGIWKKGAIVLHPVIEVQNNQLQETLGVRFTHICSGNL